MGVFGDKKGGINNKIEHKRSNERSTLGLGLEDGDGPETGVQCGTNKKLTSTRIFLCHIASKNAISRLHRSEKSQDPWQ